MASHPGGNAHTRYLIELAFPQPQSRWLVMGGSSDSSLSILQKLGFDAIAIDPQPKSDAVRPASLLNTGFPADSFDCILSQCAFRASGDPGRALEEAARLLPKGGKLAFSDVTDDVVALLGMLRRCGFSVRHMEELEKEWKAFYPKIRGASWLPGEKNTSYVLFICERM